MRPDTFENADYFRSFAPLYKSGDSLCVAVAAACEFYIVYDACGGIVVDINLSRACAAGFV